VRNKLKILYVLEAAEGGTGRHLRDILLNLDLSLFTPELAVSVNRNQDFLEDIADIQQRGIKVHLVPMQRAISLFSDFRAYRQLRKLICGGQYRIVHTHSSKAGILGRYAARGQGVKIFHTSHVFPFEIKVSKLRQKLYLALERSAGKYTDRLIAVCDAEKQVALDHGILPEAKISVVYNGIDLAKWRPDAAIRAKCREELGLNEDDKLIGMITRFMPQKGIEILVAAAAALKPLPEKVDFLLVGDGKLKPRITRLISDQGLADHFGIRDITPCVRRYYAAIDLMVMPSLWEALPYSLLEAMVMGKAVVVSAVGGMKELVQDGENGLLFPAGDQQALTAILQKFIAGEIDLQNLGKAAQASVQEKYTLDKMMAGLQEAYQEELAVGKNNAGD